MDKIMKDYGDIADKVDELDYAAGFSMDELGEWWSGLAQLWPRVLDGGSKEFIEAYVKMVREEHTRFKEDFEIIEETVNETNTYKELVMKGER